MAVPAAPSGLSAEGISGSRIRLRWTDHAVDETGFKIDRSPDGVGSWVEVGRIGANLTQWINTGLTAATTNHYRVRAYNADGDSANTSVASAATLALGVGECSHRYAEVADVQSLVWSTTLVFTDSSEPARWQVEDWLCQVSKWIDSTLCWRYGVPVTDAGDRERLRTPCALVVGGLAWETLKTRYPGEEARGRELRAAGLSMLVINPSGLGSWLPGGTAIITSKDPRGMGRSFLELPNTAEVSGTAGSRRSTPVSNLREPGEDGEPERWFTTDRR